MFSVTETAPLTTMASAVFFGAVTFTAVSLTAKVALFSSGDHEQSGAFLSVIHQAAQNPRSSALDLNSFTSIYTLLYHATIFGVLLLYAYICEYHPPFPHSEKSYDRDEFFFLTALLLLASAFTLKKNDETTTTTTTTSMKAAEKAANENGITSSVSVVGCSDWGFPPSCVNSVTSCRAVAPANSATEVLNRDQTEEWKGWMQFMFLLYHYFHAAEVYNAIRIMITCYVWMTGFGNFSFFYLKADYSAVRVLQMLWRLNFLVLFLCLTQGTTYILYYICLLHTYYFGLVYVTMRVAKHVNYKKWGIRLKMLVLAIIIFLIWDVNSGIFRLLHLPFLGDKPMLGASSGAMWEWYFRSTLDHWSTFLGMVFALNFPITSLFFRKLEAQPLLYHVTAKAAVGIALLVALYVWVTGPFQLGKFDYNQTNSYFGIIPVLTYIYFRNLTPWLRSHTLDLLHQIGKTTLETYLMQHHIWLTSNAKSLLTLIPGWPKMNFLVVSIIYVYVSRRLYRLTLFLRGMMLPNNYSACVRNLLGLVAAIGTCFGIAWFLKLLHILNLFTVAVCSVVLGFLLYNVIVQHTWPPCAVISEEQQGSASLLRRIASPSAGAVVVLLVGTSWHYMATIGANKIVPLPATCSNAVVHGHWVPVDACSANSRGSSYRDYSIASMGTCDATTWGWEATPASEHCRFAHRDPKTLIKTLKHRNVTFVGDSVLRHLYHATCRQMGDPAAGSYNTSMGKWSDFSRKYGNVAMEFRWAPFVGNLTTTIQRILQDDKQTQARPDLVVIGGGAWDRLHMYNTTAEQDVLHKSVSTLKQTLQRLGNNVPVAWVVPTMINSWALATVQKRANIREEQMQEFRTLYRDTGIHDAVSFVLNGSAFTVDRVQESYDGVHYPLSVYDGGAQILANAMDWLLPEPVDESNSLTPPHPGSMANAFLGVLMMIFVIIGIFLMDGFMGVSYIAAWVVPTVAPRNLYDEAFISLHKTIVGSGVILNGGSVSGDHCNLYDKAKHSDRGDDDVEMESLLSSVDDEDVDGNGDGIDAASEKPNLRVV